jgi:uncharacterized protein (TIGR02145 family)
MKCSVLRLILSAVLLVIFSYGCKKSGETNLVKDIDGNSYQTVQIGDQIWMKENLRTTKFNDGTVIPEDNLTWNERTDAAWSHVNEDPANNARYGKLYNGFAVISGKLCPEGWRMPTVDDWDELNEFLESSVGGKLKATTDWDEPNADATNSSGFTALPAGQRDINGNWNDFGVYAYFWTITPNEFETDKLNTRNLLHTFAGLLTGYADKIYGYSCRCIKE